MFGFILLLIYVLLIIVAVVTFRKKDKYLRWSFIVLPPLILVLFFWIPFDIMTIPFWLPAGVAFLWSIVTIVLRSIKLFIRRINQSPAEKNEKARFVRPVLTIILFLTAREMIHLSRDSADRYGIEAAKQLQAKVVKQGICPEKIEGWMDSKQDWYKSHIIYGKYCAKYILRYSISEDKKEFKISVRHNIDEALCIYGGVEKKLKAELTVEDRISEVPIE